MRRSISGTTRGEKPLCWNLDKQLLAYTATAGAAGVAALAMVQSAEAKVVYTPANTPIQLNGGPVYLDLNDDGVADFALQSSTYQAARIPRRQKHPSGLPFFQDLEAIPQGAGDAVLGYIDNSQGLDVGCAAALPQGAKVGPKSPFLTSNRVVLFSVVETYTYPHEACEWAQKHRGAFLGVKFSINGETHYGWAHITLGSKGTVLNGYAYETVANQPIETGKTSGTDSAAWEKTVLPRPQSATLGALARGSHGLAIWRKPESDREI
jgi:hypothetical protein